MKTAKEIFVVASSGSGHLFPCVELCKQLSSRDYKATLVLPSNLASSVPSAFHHHPLLGTVEVAPFSGPPKFGPNMAQDKMGLELEAHLSSRSIGQDSAQPACAIIDFQMGWTKHIFWKFGIPVITFFTFGACAAAMEWGAWNLHAKVDNPGEVHAIPGLPEDMQITYSDITRQRKLRSRASGSGGGGPPRAGDQPPWVQQIEGSVALMFNTSDHLERPFLGYMVNQLSMPAWGVGPLLPEQLLVKSNSLIFDTQIRQPKHQNTNYSESEVGKWLNTKPKKSVLYVAFGSELSPTMEEYSQLATAFQEMIQPFIWVVQSSQNLEDLESRIGDRGLIIRGWAPQLLILSHPSTGAFLSHCGWNSTVEAIALGVPILAWPIRGDQIYNAKLVVNYLKMGYMAFSSDSSRVVKEDILEGIVKIMSDEEVHKNAVNLCFKFYSGLPTSLDAAFDGFKNFLEQRQLQKM